MLANRSATINIWNLSDSALAKAMEPAASSDADLRQSPTLTMQATQAGMILGTAAYMSPEQAKGKSVDKRADNWAFGVVLVEMLTGVGAFGGNDITEVLAAVVMKDPDWQELPSDLPPPVRRILETCLRREIRSRLRDIGDARIAIEDYLTDPEAGTVPTLLHPTSTALWKAPTVRVIVAVAMTLAVFATWFLKPVPDVPEPPLIRTTITADQLQQSPAPPVLSLDGRILVYGVADRLWIRYLDQFDPAPLPDSEGAQSPFFSSDSQYLGYAQDGKLLKVQLASGARSPVCDIPGGFAGATWGMDGSIVFGVLGGGLYQVSDQGGDPSVLLERVPGGGPKSPHCLPGQKGILFNDRFERGIHLLANGKLTTILSQEGTRFSAAVYSSSGYLIYRRDGSNAGLHAVAFSTASLQITGDPFLINPQGRWPSVSRDERLSYWIGTNLEELVRVDRSGQGIGTIGQPQEYIAQPALSPDGSQVAVSAEQGANRNIWLHDVQRGTKTRLSSSREVEVAE